MDTEPILTSRDQIDGDWPILIRQERFVSPMSDGIQPLQGGSKPCLSIGLRTATSAKTLNTAAQDRKSDGLSQRKENLPAIGMCYNRYSPRRRSRREYSSSRQEEDPASLCFSETVKRF